MERTALTGVSKLAKQRHLTCIKKFCMYILPMWNEISKQDPEMQKIFGGDVKSLGIEKFIEVVSNLFKNNVLRLVAGSTRNFVVWAIINNQIYILYDSEKIKREDVVRNGERK